MASTYNNLDNMSFYYNSDGSLLYYVDDIGVLRNPDGSIYQQFVDVSSSVQAGVNESIFPPSTIKEIFQTDAIPVHSLLNIDTNVNLASIANKIYLIYGGNITTTTTTTPVINSVPIATTTTTTAIKNIIVSYPSENSIFTLGQTVEIQWTSSASINDAVSIELVRYVGSSVELVNTISSKSSNTGTYEWDVPLGVSEGDNYAIRMTLLKASEPKDPDISISGVFELTVSVVTTTTTTTPYIDPDTEDENINYYGIPILVLPDNEYVTDMIIDNYKGGVLFSTSLGRILYCNEISVNAYLTGNRRVYAEVKDGFGNKSETAFTDLMYSLQRRIMEISSGKEIIKNKYAVNPAAIASDSISGVFLSPILAVREDLGFWNKLIWQEEKNTHTDIIICVRSGETEEDLKSKPWDFCFSSNDSDRVYGSTGYIIRDLMGLGLKGKYIQFKVTMTTNKKDISPSLLNVSISYSTKYAVYFFTTKFVLEKNSDIKTGLLIANVSEPQNTEVRFGISDTNSNNWNDYTVVGLDKLFDLNNLDKIKIGIKMVNYGDNIPTVSEFSLISGGTIQNLLN